MLPPEIAKQIHLLDIRTNRVVDEITGGAYRSVFKGRGIEFDEVREYTPEDDVRDIDWNVSARMGSPYIKKYIEERELTVLLLVDVSASGAFGSAEKTKRRTAAELAALLAFSAGRNGDKVGLMMFSDRIELYVPPKSGRRHTLRLIREMLAFEPASPGTDIAMALRETAQMLKKRSVIFLISDLISEESFEASLKILNRKHDCIALQIFDPVEHRLGTLRRLHLLAHHVKERIARRLRPRCQLEDLLVDFVVVVFVALRFIDVATLLHQLRSAGQRKPRLKPVAQRNALIHEEFH